MQIEKIAVRLRRRTPWEALDLGHAMLRAWAGPAYRAWLASYWIVGIGLLLAFWSSQTWGMLILWWLKPFFDRILLFAFSRSLFNTPTTGRDIRAALPGLVRHSGLFTGLTLRRLSMARSFLLPVWQLEGQSGAAARARSKVLSRRARGNAMWLTFVCANVTGVLFFSLVMLIHTLMPETDNESLSIQAWFTSELTPQREFFANILMMVAESLVEPLYVASGFALYLHRRSELEGWDIELSFRRLAARMAPAAQAVLALFGAVAIGACLLLSPPAAQAAQPLPAAQAAAAEPDADASPQEDEAEDAETSQPDEAAASPSPAKTTIDAVLADPVFGHKVQEMEWKWRDDPDPADEKKTDWGWLNKLGAIMEFSGQVMRALMWIVALVAATLLLYLIVRYREGWLGLGGNKRPPPEFLFGLDVRPESLPDDIAGAARAALAAGRVELALSLLYRGALVALIHRTPVEFRPGDTEDDCRQRVAGHLEAPASDYFGRLVDAWGATAYAHLPPPQPALEGLCQDWAQHFGAPGGRPA